MTTLKKRHHIYLSDRMTAVLESLGDAPGSSKSAMVEKALEAWVTQSAGNALDDRFARRLDRQTRELHTVVDNLDFLREAFGTFVRHQLTLAAHQPAFTPETVQLGHQRYLQFVEIVGRNLARTRSGAAVDAEVAANAQPET